MRNRLLMIVCLFLVIFASNTLAKNVRSPDQVHQNIWNELRKHFRLGDAINHPEVQRQVRWISEHPSYLQKVAKQSRPYLYYVIQQLHARNLPGELALLPMIESSYDPFAFSGAGAAGLWQFMPGTATGLGLKQNWWYDGRRDIKRSTRAALDYLIYLHSLFDGDWFLALAAYDAGEGKVQKSRKRNQGLQKPTDYWSLRLPRETTAYIPRLLAIASIIRHPNYYPIKLPHIPNEPYFKEVMLKHQIDLSYAAKLASMDLNEFYRLNPGYNRWATAPNGPYHLILPIENASIFKRNYAKLPKSKPVTWSRHQVSRGESLSVLAKKYKTTTALIKKANKLKTHDIRIGQALLIPQSAKKLASLATEKKRKRAVEYSKRIGPQQVRHFVQSHDTLSQLAKRYHVTPAAIRYWNKIRYSKKIKRGQELIIWVPQKYARTRKKLVRYRVKAGDSLGKIAKRYKLRVKQIASWNKLKDHSKIRIGQTLVLYA